MSELTDMIGVEIDKRIDTIEDPGYEPVAKIGKIDMIMASIISAASLVVLIYAYNVLT